MSQYDDRPWANAQTIAIIKPDAVRRHVVGEILLRLDQEPFEILRMRLLLPDTQLPGFGKWNPRKFYAMQHEGQPHFEPLVSFMSSGPSIAMLLKRSSATPERCAIPAWRSLMGPWKKEEHIPGTIRGDLMLDGLPGMQNLVHGSDSPESFVHEYACLEDVL